MRVSDVELMCLCAREGMRAYTCVSCTNECMIECVRACVRACASARVRAGLCVCACVPACVCVCVRAGLFGRACVCMLSYPFVPFFNDIEQCGVGPIANRLRL